MFFKQLICRCCKTQLAGYKMFQLRFCRVSLRKLSWSHDTLSYIWTRQQQQCHRRCCATFTKPQPQPQQQQDSYEEWLTIYRLPIIRFVASLNRLKIYQAALTAVGTPVTFALAEVDQVVPQATTIFGIIGVSGLLTLTLSSYVLRNLVGFIYINKNQDYIKLAYVDFWGRRLEKFIEIEDLLVDCEQEQSRFKWYQSIGLYSDTQQRYKLLNRFGVVTDPELYTSLFGE